MAYDGQAEAAAILAKLSPLVGGRVYEGVPDDVAIEVYPDSSIKPFLVISFGEPFLKGSDRRMGVDDTEQVHIFPFDVTAAANSAGNARNLMATVNKLTLAWNPNPPNSGPVKPIAGYKYTTLDSQSKPSRWNRVRYMECDINLSTDS